MYIVHRCSYVNKVTYGWHMEILTDIHEMVSDFRWNWLQEFLGDLFTLRIQPGLFHDSPSIVKVFDTGVLRYFELKRQQTRNN